jgi:MraZ protein
MVIPPALRELLGLEREVVLVGVQNRLELWSKDAWDAFCRQMWPQYGKRATELAAAAVSGGGAQTAV